MRQGTRTRLLQVMENRLGVIDLNYYKKLKRIEELSEMVATYTDPEDRILDLCSGAFLLECILEDKGYIFLTAVDVDDRLSSLHKHFTEAGLLKHTIFHKQEITEFQSAELYSFITLYDCAYYPGNNIVSMLPQLQKLLKNGGWIFFDVYDESVYRSIRFFYNHFRKKYRNRKMYNLDKVNCALIKNGFEIINVNVELGTKNIFFKLFLTLIYRFTGRALVVRYLVRKNGVN
ncbi:MAG: methyltransferase domain-containing protein [Desulfobacteraceae bacterium]|nr:MAG: methyltransferase domain-containing protein [Desulfobacteraceae bacterium]